MVKYSRKRFQEAIRACKQICKNEKLPAVTRLRSAELIYLLYGGELPGGNTKRDKRSIKDLVQERSLEKQVRTTVDEQTQPQTEAEAEKDWISAALAEFLKPTQTEGSGISNADTQKTAPTVHAPAPPTPAEERERRRWLHALAVVADGSLSQEMRLAAIVRVKAGLPDSHSLKNTRAEALLKRVLPPWSERPYMEGGRAVMRRISSPPTSLADVWE